MNAQRYVMSFIPLVAVALVGCSAGSDDPAPSFEQSSVSASSAPASASPEPENTENASSAPAPVDRGELSQDQVNGITDTLAKVKEEGNAALHESSDAVKKVLDKYLFGNEQAINWVTLLSQGGQVDSNSLSGEATGKFSGNIVDSEGRVLAYISGVYEDGKISPVHYEQTSDGDNFRDAHKADAAEWATN